MTRQIRLRQSVSRPSADLQGDTLSKEEQLQAVAERLVRYQVVSDLPLNTALLGEVKTRMDAHFQVAACPRKAASTFSSLAALHEV